MFGIIKNNLIKGLALLAAKSCSYTKQPCDCKFLKDSDIDSGFGCPEIKMAAVLIANMTNQEFLAIANRAGIIIMENEDYKVIDVIDMITKVQETKFTSITDLKVSKKKIK